MKNITITGKRKDTANMLLDILLILEDENCSEDICINVGMDKYPSVVIEPTDKSCPMVNCNGRENGIQLRQAKKIIKMLVHDCYSIAECEDTNLGLWEDDLNQAKQFIGEDTITISFQEHK